MRLLAWLIHYFMKRLFTVLLLPGMLFGGAGCRSGDGSSLGSAQVDLSSHPRFAREYIQSVARQCCFPGDKVTTFVGATPIGAPFVAVVGPMGYIDGVSGRRVSSKGEAKNTFVAYNFGSLVVVFKGGDRAELSRLVKPGAFSDWRVIVGDEGLITLRIDLLDILLRKQAGVWRVDTVHCRFAPVTTTLEQLNAETAALEKTGWGDITFPPGHAEREKHYRKMILSYMATAGTKPAINKIYSSQDTSSTGYLMLLLHELRESGAAVTFEK